jgi:predicted oxidoreductase
MEPVQVCIGFKILRTTHEMKLSPIIAGTMKWGAWGARLDAKGFATNIHAALEAGIHTFDHADIYGGYTTEADFGAGFVESSVDRSAVVFITKCGIRYPEGNNPAQVKHYDYSAAHIRQSAENSLRYLRTDYIDIFLLHRPSPLLDTEEAIGALEQLKSEGKIREWGVSNFTAPQMDRLAAITPPAWNQIECSLTHTAPMLDGTLDAMQTQKMGGMAWSPLGSVFQNSPEAQRLKPVLERLSEQYECTTAQLVLAWLHRHPSGIIPVIGTTQPNRIQELAAAHRIQLDTLDWFALTEASWGHKVP